MNSISVFLQAWEYLRDQANATVQTIDEANAWEYRINENEFSVKQTFYHTLKSIFEDAGNWFLDDPTLFKSCEDPKMDVDISVGRMIKSIQKLPVEKLTDEFHFPWGGTTTIAGAIHQTLFHSVGHISQLRNWVGIKQRMS